MLLLRRLASSLADRLPEVPRPKLQEAKFISRHLGNAPAETQKILNQVGYPSMEEFVRAFFHHPSSLQDIEHVSEYRLGKEVTRLAKMNSDYRHFIGQGFVNSVMPPVINKMVLENPGWYSPYTPYQAEIAQGRLESLFNFQTMVSELTGLPVANASMLDEASALADALTMIYYALNCTDKTVYFCGKIGHDLAKQVDMRAHGLGLKVRTFNGVFEDALAIVFQYPDLFGDLTFDVEVIARANELGVPIVSIADPLCLALVKPPGELGASVAVGSMQRFGIEPGYGGPSAAFVACTNQYLRFAPGRIVGMSKDAEGNPAYRLALQTREQHIRREKAHSNICTSQALMANAAAFYGIYHGPDGLKAIADQIQSSAVQLAEIAERLGHRIRHWSFFDTIVIEPKEGETKKYHELAAEYKIRLGHVDEAAFGVCLDESVCEEDMADLVRILSGLHPDEESQQIEEVLPQMEDEQLVTFGIPETLRRESPFMRQAVFNRYHSETELARYINHLGSKDVSLVDTMIPLGSCTMKLNPSAALLCLRERGFTGVHPKEMAVEGYRVIFRDLSETLMEITGLPYVSLQPKSGAQGEYYALSLIKRHVTGSGRDLCLIPQSAHGTNGASAKLAGLQIQQLRCGMDGRLDLEALIDILDERGNEVAVLMVTYPSTYGIFDRNILIACEMVKAKGAFVYLDGANMNAVAGYAKPAEWGVDACHLNLHKTFAIPHGGGGPGAGPVAMTAELASGLERLDKHLVTWPEFSEHSYGSASILAISWSCLKLLGSGGVREATAHALLNANYMKARLGVHYPIKFLGPTALCAHEFIIDFKPIEAATGVTAFDVAKRLQDYGFHAPTIAWPVLNSMMIEPTESEGMGEMGRFVEAMVSIWQEIRQIEDGAIKLEESPLRLAPHTQQVVCSDTWNRAYSRETAAFPLAFLRSHKKWPAVSRLDDAHGDLNFVGTRKH